MDEGGKRRKEEIAESGKRKEAGGNRKEAGSRRQDGRQKKGNSGSNLARSRSMMQTHFIHIIISYIKTSYIPHGGQYFIRITRRVICHTCSMTLEVVV